jgi:hypothetical protein
VTAPDLPACMQMRAKRHRFEAALVSAIVRLADEVHAHQVHQAVAVLPRLRIVRRHLCKLYETHELEGGAMVRKVPALRHKLCAAVKRTGAQMRGVHAAETLYVLEKFQWLDGSLTAELTAPRRQQPRRTQSTLERSRRPIRPRPKRAWNAEVKADGTVSGSGAGAAEGEWVPYLPAHLAQERKRRLARRARRAECVHDDDIYGPAGRRKRKERKDRIVHIWERVKRVHGSDKNR